MRRTEWRLGLATLLILGMVTNSQSHTTLASSAKSDWPMVGGGPGRTFFNASEHSLKPARLRLRWAVPSPSAYIVASGSVFAVVRSSSESTGTQIVAYDAGTGTLKRRYARYFGYDANPNLAYDRGRLYVAGNMLEAFDAATGRELFTTHVAYPSKYGILHGAMEDPIVSDGLVFTSIGRLQNGGFSARYFAFDASTGRLRWSVGRDGATLTASGRRVYVAYDDQGCDAPGCVQSHGAAYNARSGQVLWQRPMTDEASGAWMAAGGRLYQAREARGANLNYPGPASTVSFTVAGVEKWRAQGFVPLAVANGRIFGLYHQHFAALSAATGRLIWHRPESEDHALLYQIRSPMAVANGVVYLAQRKDIEAVDATSGKRLAVIPLPRSFTSFGDIEIADGMLLEIANSCCDASGAYTGSSLLAFSRNSAER